MVGTTKCDHCGADANFVIKKEFDGKVMNFCCKGCLGVYEMLREEKLAEPDSGSKTERKKFRKLKELEISAKLLSRNLHAHKNKM